MSLKQDYVIRKETLSKVISVLLAICSVAAIGINFENITGEGGIIWAVLSSFQGWGLGQTIFVLCLAILYHYIYNNFSIQKDIAVFSIFLSFLMLIGLCYRNATGIALCILNTAQLIKTLIVLVGYGILLYCFVFLLYRWMCKLVKDYIQKQSDISDCGKNYRLKTGLFLFICWLPYLIAFYPGTALYDAGTMLAQYFGYEILTNHHPYFQILFLGSFVKIGVALGSASIGIFLYVLVQVLAFIMVLAYMADLFRKLGISRHILRGITCLYAFLPIFPVYAISIGKNINFAIVILLLTIFMFEIWLFPDEFVHNFKKMILLPILLILVCLFRNEGLAIAIGCFPCFIILAKKYWKILGSIFAGVILFIVIWFQWILPTAGVASGSIAESLSIPFLQTARCVVYYGDEMSEEERVAIDNVLEFDTLPGRYLPEFSDRVKERYNNDATEEELQAYMNVYWQQLLAHPLTYLDALLNKCYGYFFPDDPGRTKDYYVVGMDIFQLNVHGYSLNSKFHTLVKGMNEFMTTFRNIPLLGYTTSIGLYFWCTFLFMFFSIKCKRVKLLTLYIPAILILFVCMASPVNAYFRYGLSVVFTVPFFFLTTLYGLRESKPLQGQD